MKDGPIAILNGPGVHVDRDGLQRWCDEWSNDLGVNLSCQFAGDERELMQALADASSEARGILVNPGTGDVVAVQQAVEGSALPVVWVDVQEAERPRPRLLEDVSVAAIRGRGVWGYRWAAQYLLQRLEWPFTVVPYGSERDQVGDLRLPANGDGPWPVAVLLHGGFWRERWERDTIEPLAIDLTRRGFATWNLEYRRVGPFGGGWPSTCEDVAAGIDALADLADLHPLDLSRVVYIGHSAGGQLALWAVKRHGMHTPARVSPMLVVSLAGVADLEECAHRGLGDTGDAAAALMGAEPEQRPAEYAAASPMRSLPLGVPQLVVQGRLDNTPDLVDMSRLYAQAASEAGDSVDFLELDDADHFHLIVPSSHAWPLIVERIERSVW